MTISSYMIASAIKELGKPTAGELIQHIDGLTEELLYARMKYIKREGFGYMDTLGRYNLTKDGLAYVARLEERAKSNAVKVAKMYEQKKPESKYTNLLGQYW